MKPIAVLFLVHVLSCAAVAWHYITGVEVERRKTGRPAPEVVELSDSKIAYLEEEYVDYAIKFPTAVWIYGVAGLLALLGALVWEILKLRAAAGIAG